MSDLDKFLNTLVRQFGKPSDRERQVAIWAYHFGVENTCEQYSGDVDKLNAGLQEAKDYTTRLANEVSRLKAENMKVQAENMKLQAQLARLH